jgi:hypothetical protein
MSRISRWMVAALKLLKPVRVPELVIGLPTNFRAGTEEITRRLNARFPPGSSEERLITELARQGFEPDPSTEGVDGICHSRTFYRRELIFVTLWSVRWRSHQGKIASIFGVYGQRAP